MRHVEIHHKHIGDTRVIVGGQDISDFVTEVFWCHAVGDPATATVDLLALPGSSVEGEARVRVLFGGVEFSLADVEGLRSGDPEVARDVADRMAGLIAKVGA